MAQLILLMVAMSAQNVLAQDCPDLSGTWSVTESVTLTTTVTETATGDSESETETETATDTVEMTQDGCTVRFFRSLPDPGGGTIQVERVGTIEGDTVTFTGIAAVPAEGATCSPNSFVAVGTIDGNRIDATTTVDVRCTVPGFIVTITGNGTAVFIGPPPRFTLQGEVKQQSADGPPLAGVELYILPTTTHTDASGVFRFDDLLAGLYDFFPSKSGFLFEHSSSCQAPLRRLQCLVNLNQDLEMAPFIAHRDRMPEGSYETFIAHGVAVSGDYTYIADNMFGLQVIDISDKANPVKVGNYDTLTAYGVAVSGDYAYVADGLDGLRVINISDPTSPVQVGQADVKLGARAEDVAVVGNYAFLLQQDLFVIDISDPTSPMPVGSVGSSIQFDEYLGVAVSGNHAYVADEQAGLQVINLDDLANPVLVGQHDTSGHASGVAVSGNLALVADSDGTFPGEGEGLVLFDITDPTNPVRLGNYDTGDARDVAVCGDYAYVADFDAGLRVIDISDPTNPVRVDGSSGFTGLDVVVDDGYIYVAAHFDGLIIINEGWCSGALFQINAGLNDAWFNIATAGQGFFIIVFPVIKAMFVAMFTFETELPDESITAILGAPEQRWFTAFGDYVDNQAVLDIEITSDGVFDSPEPVVSQVPDGTLTVEFEDCGTGMITYNIPSIDRQGVIPIQRLADDNKALCETLNAQ